MTTGCPGKFGFYSKASFLCTKISFVKSERRSFGLNKPQKRERLGAGYLIFFDIFQSMACQTKMQAAFLNPSFGTVGSRNGLLLLDYLLMKPLGVSLKHWHFFKRVNASNLTHFGPEASWMIGNCGLIACLGLGLTNHISVWLFDMFDLV